MMRVRSALLASLLAVTGSFGASGTARAQSMSEGETKAAARAAFLEGIELQNQGKPAEALSRFESAEKLYDAPTHVLHIAQCQALTGHLVDAAETYDTLTRRPLGKDAPKPFLDAQEQAKAELEQVRKRIPKLRVNVKPAPSTLQNLQITLNDRVLPNELVGLERPVNPGPYHVTATAAGYGAAPIDVEIKEGEPKTVDLTLQPGGATVVGPSSAAAAPPPYEAGSNKGETKSGPSPTGFLFGIRPGVFVPGGKVNADKKFDRVGTAGPGIGLDAIVRVARVFLIGGTLEITALGPPTSSSIASNETAEGTASTYYLGVVGGILPNVDRVSFLGDVTIGIRQVSRNETLLRSGTRLPKTEEEYGGYSAGLNVGLSIPLGPIRLVPKTGIAFGSLSCNDGTATVLPRNGGCSTNIDGAGHTMFNLVLGAYYHVDTTKKPAGS